ncbi:hypothetical protein FC682_26525 [Peribacillus simplex]|uniref:DUF6060 domain-containing protein n=1 Tax=Peribacillus simplex TaxID=1478 RepID=UPI0010BECBFF|nr:hypothetical protein [Peribacillus simplex]TKG98327.1 hypothetical protein FC682_26525 [Peribacillus simplex]
MGKYIKSFLTVLTLSIVFLVVSADPSFAAKSEGATKAVKIDKKSAIYDKSLGKYVTPLKKVNGKLVPASKQEYLNEIQSASGQSAAIPKVSALASTNDMGTLDYREYWKYTPTSTTSKVTGKTKKVTADIGCTSASCSITKNVSVTVSASYSVSATAEKSAIKANAGFTWVSSASDSSTYSFTLKKGDKGYVGFKPYYKKTTGKLKKYSNWDGYLYSKSASAQSPRKTANKEADGMYYFVHY